jgi:hypothetical protein
VRDVRWFVTDRWPAALPADPAITGPTTSKPQQDVVVRDLFDDLATVLHAQRWDAPKVPLPTSRPGFARSGTGGPRECLTGWPGRAARRRSVGHHQPDRRHLISSAWAVLRS